MRSHLVTLVCVACAAATAPPRYVYDVSIKLRGNTFRGDVLIVPESADVTAVRHAAAQSDRTKGGSYMMPHLESTHNHASMDETDLRADREVSNSTSPFELLSNSSASDRLSPKDGLGMMTRSQSENIGVGKSLKRAISFGRNSPHNVSVEEQRRSPLGRSTSVRSIPMLTDTRRKRSVERMRTMLSRKYTSAPMVQQPSLLSNQESIVFGDTAGGHVRFTLGPRLVVHSAQLLVRDAPEVEPSPRTWRQASMASLQSALSRIGLGSTELEREGNTAAWRPVQSILSNPERGVYIVRPADGTLNLRELVAHHLETPHDLLAIRVHYSGPITDISRDMEPSDVEARLWRGALWRWSAAPGRTVYGATAAAAPGRLGHVARLMPVMRTPDDASDAGMAGQEAAIGRIHLSVHHLSTHALHAASDTATSTAGHWPRVKTVSSFSVDCGSRASVLPANVGWVLLPACAQLSILNLDASDVETGLAPNVQAILHVPAESINSALPQTAQAALERALSAEEGIAAAVRTGPLRVIVLPRLAHALRSATPENIVFVADAAPQVVARATAMCVLQWRNHALQRVRPTPWLLEAMAAYIVDESAKTHLAIGQALAVDDRREHGLEALSAVDDAAVAKGVSILRMLAQVTGKRAFRDAVMRSDTPLTAEDLAQRVEWRASKRGICLFPFSLGAENADMAPAELVLPWATHPSLPMVAVDYENGRLIISQRPVNPAAAGAVWPVPVIVTALTDSTDQLDNLDDDSGQKVVFADILLDRPAVIPIAPGTHLRLVNAERTEGFYRVHYTARAVRSGLFSFDPTQPGASDAAEDAFALALHRCISVDESLELVRSMLAATFAAVPAARLGVLRFVRANLDALHLALRGDDRGMRRHMRDLTRDIVRAVMAIRNPGHAGQSSAGRDAQNSDSPSLEIEVEDRGRDSIESDGHFKPGPGKELEKQGTIARPKGGNHSPEGIAFTHVSDETTLKSSGSSTNMAKLRASQSTEHLLSGSGENKPLSRLHHYRGALDPVAMRRLRLLSQEHKTRMAAHSMAHKTALRKSSPDSDQQSTYGDADRRSGKATLAHLQVSQDRLQRTNSMVLNAPHRPIPISYSVLNTEESYPGALDAIEPPQAQHLVPLSTDEDWLVAFDRSDRQVTPPVVPSVSRENSEPEALLHVRRIFDSAEVSFDDPLLGDHASICSHLGAGTDECLDDETHINRLLFGMRLQTGDLAAVATAQRLFEAHVAGVGRLSSYDDAAVSTHSARNELLDSVLRAASVYGDRRTYIQARDLSSGWRRPGDSFPSRVIRRVSEQVAETSAAIAKDPAVVPKSVFNHVLWWVLYNIWMAKAFFAFPTSQYIKTLTNHAPYTADAWAAWDTVTSDQMARYGYTAGCFTVFDPAYNLLPYIALYVFRYFTFLIFCSQSYYAITSQAFVLDSLREALALTSQPSDWATTAHERADPAAWLDAVVSYTDGHRAQSFPAESSYQARARAVDERRSELVALDDDWLEADEQHPPEEEEDDMILPILRH